ncbi:HAMP domain-containing sensor histidine kinase [Amycolatopsis sp. PS_44_ISF1]|uniref:sensor histidine kinase n=1 Tax=Amycolatopsis sp. PS_44_ISF1 TaxID=2974917 RepID=UPI0028DF7AE5|nr:HAMP domain-containing sensor histidine kinase [Amycolatopsis sp. PS_44_ISF1]MDT8911734.1 HAMP domain-containing histidine kinase [Amycolatopsis sp. PS_44_ISF1]
MRRSLLIRWIAVSALVALCAIAATALLAAKTTTGAIQQEQGQVFADDGSIYQGLLSYAAAHPDWTGAGPVVRKYAEATGRRVVLTTPQGKVIAGSDAEPRRLPAQPSVVIDPLSVDPGLGVPSTPDRIDPSAVGPYALTADEREDLLNLASKVQSCMEYYSGLADIEVGPGGHPRVVAPESYALTRCGGIGLEQPVKTEQIALEKLNSLVSACFGRTDPSSPAVGVPPMTWTFDGPVSTATDPATRSCVTSARREQLTPYVAPAAWLYITEKGSDQPPSGFTLSSENRVRLIALAGGILLLTIVVTGLASIRLIRPLHALTGAAQRMKAGETGARVRVRGKDEIARLAVAFNEMSETRERLETARKAMVSDIAHELRTPLSTIRGWLEATQDGISRLDQELAASLLEEALHLQHIVDDLQDLALADAGSLRVHPEPIDANVILTQLAAAHAPRAEASGVRLTVTPMDEPELTADPVRLRQSLDNLVSNAVRHTPRDGAVTVTGRREGGDVVFEVTDTGVGITSEDLPHVFDRFWRADRSRARGSGGSGLGLAIVRNLAEAHGGAVAVASTPGHGSTFTLRLPSEGPA